MNGFVEKQIKLFKNRFTDILAQRFIQNPVKNLRFIFLLKYQRLKVVNYFNKILDV